MSDRDEALIGGISTPERNNYFYGQLLDEAALRKEQNYGRFKSALRNRALVGSGVACGLALTSSSEGEIFVGPGLAIDPAGRELVVSEPVPVPLAELTDDTGEPTGVDASGMLVEICLAYRQECTDPVPVLVPDCGDEDQCAPSTIREGVAVIVREATTEPEPPACSLETPVSPGQGLYEELCKRIAEKEPGAATDACVVLGRIQNSDAGPDIRMCEGGRQLALGNEVLFDLILCLAQRVDALST